MKSHTYRGTDTYKGADAPDPDDRDWIVERDPIWMYEVSVPRIFDVLNLSASAFRLLFHLWAVCEASSVCDETTTDLALACNLSRGTVVNAKRELLGKQLLLRKSRQPGQPQDTLRIRFTALSDANIAYMEVRYGHSNTRGPNWQARQLKSLQNLNESGVLIENFDLSLQNLNEPESRAIHERGHTSASSKESKYFHKRVQSSLDEAFGPSTFNYNPSRLSIEFPPSGGPRNENSDAFSSPVGPARSAGPKFKLKPTPGPNESPPPPRKRRPRNPKILKGPDRIPWYVHKAMYKLCYGITTDKQAKALTKEMAGRVASVLQRLQAAGADVTDVYRFGTWWTTWAKFRPTPEKVQEFWWRAIDELDRTHREVKDLSDERAKRRAEELEESARDLETAIRRQRGEGFEIYEGWTDEQVRAEAYRRAESYANRPK